MRSGGDSVAALGYHARAGDIAHDLRSRQMTADAGLCALTHFYFDCSSAFQKRLVNAEATGGDLNDGVSAVFIKVLMQTALAGVVVDTERLRGAGERLMSVIAYRAVAHGGEHHRDI